MNSLATLFFRQPRLIILSVLVLTISGASAFLSIGKQEDPTITNLFASVTTVYPGAEPGRVESLVTEKIESELQQISSIALIDSTSASGISIISIELEDTLDGASIDIAWNDIQSALDDARLSLPAEALEPDLRTDADGTFSSIVALKPAPEVTLASTQRYAEMLADRLRRVSGTNRVELFGEVVEEVLVTINERVLSELGISIDQLASSIAQADTKTRAGRVRAANTNMVIELSAKVDSLEQIRNVPVRAVNGAITRVGDIATVTLGVRQPMDEMALASGDSALLVAARIDEGLQIDTWMQSVNAVLDDFESVLPDAIELERIFDQSVYTSDRLSAVAVNMAMGVTLVVLVLLVTLGVRAALIVAMVLPLVTLASIATMNAFGLSIHQMSLTGLIVALGLLVDAAIVMTDEVRQRLAAGFERVRAVEQSVRRLFAPLLASTVTTALSFMPMVLLPGPAGDFVGSIALAVIIMLSWSFLIAVSITAATAGWLLPLTGNALNSRGSGVSLPRLSLWFRKTLRLAVTYPLSSVLLALVLPVMGFLSMGTLTAQFFPSVDRNQFHIEVELPAGSSIQKTAQTTLAIDQLIRAEEGVDQVTWVIGKSAPSFYYNMVGDRERAPQFSQALVTTSSAEITAELVPELQATLDAQITEARILVRNLVQGPPVDAPVEIRIIGPNLQTLREQGERLRELLSGVDTISTVRTSLEGGAPKIVIDVDQDSASMAGLSQAGIARQLDASLDGSLGGSMLQNTEQMSIRVRVDDDFRADLSSISNLSLLVNAQGSAQGSAQRSASVIPLSSVSSVFLQPAQSVISRRNGERVNSVQAFVRYGVLPEEALNQVQERMQSLDFALPDGYRLQYGGDSDARSDTLTNLLAPLGLIVTLSIAAVVMTFNSFRLAGVTFVVALLSAGLSMLALAVFQYPFGINAIIGVIGSIGVSVNAAIIILTGLQKSEMTQRGSTEAMVDVVMGSSRHIVSTTVTTFGGFLPLILDGGGFWPPFAMAVAGGVLLSTVVSFYFTPPMYRMVHRGAFKAA